MKKIIVVMLTTMCVIFGYGQSEKVARPKLKFKHSAGPEQCRNCLCPLGICFQIPLSADQITDKEALDGFGYANAKIVKNKLNLIFENEAALEDGNIPIDGDMQVSEEISQQLGYKKIVIKQGLYTVDFSNHKKFGEVFLEIEIE